MMKPFVLDEPVNGTYWPELENPKKLGDCGTGYYNVCIHTDNTLLTGYIFVYLYDIKGRDYRSLSSISIKELEAKVKNHGLPWEIIDEQVAKDILAINLIDLEQREELIASKNPSGIKYVHRKKTKDHEYWFYNALIDGKGYQIYADTLSEMYSKVKARKAPWVIINRNLYTKILREERVYL